MKRILSILLLCLVPSIAQAQYTISPPPFLTALDNTGKIVNNGCIWTYLAGTTTAAVTYQATTGTPNLNPIRSDSAGRFTAFLTPGVSYKFVYETSCTPPSHGTTLRTADNIAAMPTSAANVDITGTAGETFSAGDCAYLSNGGGGRTIGQWYRCDSGATYSSSAAVAVGIAPSAITAFANGLIRVAGRVTGLSLSAGSVYYIHSAGALDTVAQPNRKLVGIADSATSLILDVYPSGVSSDGSISILKGYGEQWQTVAIGTGGSAGNVSWDYRLGQHIIVALNANITSFTVSNCPAAGQVAAMLVIYTADGTPRTVTHTINSAVVRFPGAVAPTMSSGNTKIDKILYTSFDGCINFTGEVVAQNE